MSCPDWPSAAAWRHGDGAAPPGWQACLEHLAGCAPCRRRVGALDPTLLLATAAAAPAPAVDDAEAGAIRATVRSLVAAERLGSRGRPHRRSLAAAAAIAVLLVVPFGLSRLAHRPVAPAAPVALAAAPESAATLPEPAEEPPVEEVQPAAARVYQFGTDELPVVFIFDESLDL